MAEPKIATIESKYSGIILFVDSHHGAYIPKVFVEMINRDYWQPISDYDEKILMAGPDVDDSCEYWEVWHKFIDGSQFLTDQDGHKWFLHQDGDVFLMCEEKMTDQEKQQWDIDCE